MFSCPICEKIREIVDERLFHLRRLPGVTNEQRTLKRISLILHKADEWLSVTPVATDTLTFTNVDDLSFTWTDVVVTGYMDDD